MHAAPAQPSRAAGWALALILAAAVWLYLPVLRTDFFADDYLFLDQVRGRSLIESLRIPDPLSNFFRPVSRQLYFWTVAGLTHESPVAFHFCNLAFFLMALALLFALARRLAGARAGLIAAGVLALHYAPDVSVRWACGSQDLLAIVGAMAALLLYLAGHRVWAGVALLVAALSKEVVLLTPVIAIVAAHEPGERWLASVRRAWPLGAAVAAWALIWLLMPHARVAQSTVVEFDMVRSPFAAFANLARVVLGAEWRQGEFARLPRVPPPVVPVLAVLGAVIVGWNAWAWKPREPHPATSRDTGVERHAGARRQTVSRGAVAGDPGVRHAMVTGLVWAAVATLPVAAVAILWSAYYYLFAMCGVALALGAWLSRRHIAWSLAAIVLIAWGSASARSLDEFAVARDPWTPQSHTNRHYIERSNEIVVRYLASLRRAHPSFPTGSTLFFAGLKGSVAFQRADGPLLRWAYHDPTLRSYYLNTFTRDKIRRGPIYFFVTAGDTLRQLEDDAGDIFSRIAFSMILSGQPRGAHDALELDLERGAQGRPSRYWLAWTQWALGDTAGATASLRAAGANPERGEAGERAVALMSLAAGDTLAAIQLMRGAVLRRPFDAGVHGLLADLLLVTGRRDAESALEAFAARVLAPDDPFVWRRWAMIQTDHERYGEALGSFEQYFALGGAAAGGDEEARGWAQSIRAMAAGGRLPADAPGQ